VENGVTDVIKQTLEEHGYKVQSIDDPGRGKGKTIVLADGRVFSAPSFTECLEQLEARAERTPVNSGS
jgi:hypothetical protein